MRILSILLIISALSFGCKKKKDPVIEPAIETGVFDLSANDHVSIQVDGTRGARVSSLKINGSELLYLDQSGGNNNWGSTFWPSPQSLFNWPPPPQLDSETYIGYEGTADSKTLWNGNTPVSLKLAFEKTFTCLAPDTSINITYKMTNIGSNSLSAAPWEITRVPSGGLIFYPNETGAIPTGALASLTKDSSGVIWFDYDSTTIPSGTPKLYGDGSSEGWLAYVNNNRQLIIKKFTDTPASGFATASESEIELYADPAKKYTEIEEQGLYGPIASNGSSSWTVKWYVRTLPASVVVNVGSTSLLAYVRSVVN
jgi:hypothetical protein